MNKVKELREQNKLSKRELGRLCGVSDAYIYQLEKGERPLSKNIAQKLAQFFQVSTDEIYGTQMIKNAQNFSKSLTNLIDYFKASDYSNKRATEINDDNSDDIAWDLSLFDLISGINNICSLENYHLLQSLIDIFVQQRKVKDIMGFKELVRTELNKSDQAKLEQFNFSIDQYIKMLQELKVERDDIK